MNHPEKSEYCLNCTTPLSGENFCPNCGQKNDASKLTFKYVLSESFSNLFAFDGRFFYTLKNLFLHPGKVPKEYVAGKRTKYMNPVRIYFLTSILLLGIVQINNGANDVAKIQITENSDTAGTDNSTQSSNEDLGVPADVTLSEDEAPGFAQRLNAMGAFYLENKSMPMREALDSLGYEYTLMNRFMYKQGAKVAEFDSHEFNKFLFSKMFWVLFLFLPILALILKLVYVRRSFFYPEHLFFTFYNQSIFFLLLSIANLFSGVMEVFLLFVFLISFSVYLFIAMKRFYQQSTRKTLLKFVLLNLIIIPVFGAFFALSAFIALLLY